MIRTKNVLNMLLPIAIWFPLLKPFAKSTTNSQILSVFILSVISLIFILLKKKSYFYHYFSFYYYSIFVIFLLLSILYDSPFQRLLSDSLRYFVFSIFLIVGFNCNFNSTSLVKCIKNISVLQIAFSFFVFVPFLHPFIDHFKGRLSVDLIQFHFTRFSGSFGYPTEFGCFLVLCFMFITEKNLKLNKFSGIIFLIIIVLSICMTVSRGAFVLLFGYLLIKFLSSVVTFFNSIKLSKFNFILFLSSALIILLIFLLNNNFDQLSLLGYLLSFKGNIDSSIMHRFNELRISYQILFGYLDVPVGEARLMPFGLDVVESFWASTIIRFGQIGFFINVSFIFIFYLFYKNSYCKCVSNTIFLWFFLVYTFVAPFSDVIFRSKGVVIFGLLLGICLRLNLKNKYNASLLKLS